MADVFSVKDHTWARVDAAEGERTVKLIVYERETSTRPERYFLEYRGYGLITKLRASSRGELIHAVADAILAGDAVLPDGLDLDDAIDNCERALFGRVVSR